jgi:hypothetical protein
MEETFPGIKIDGSEGSMNELAESVSFEKLLLRHNDPADSFHLDAHQVVSLGHQFSDGVRFATFSTPSMLNNMARAKNCKWQAQGHTDGAFNWCGKEIALIGFGMNSMGAHFNLFRSASPIPNLRRALRIRTRQHVVACIQCTTLPPYAPTPNVDFVPRSHIR